MTAEKPAVLVIVGPTASGKSTLAVKLAREFNGEVISADSRQVYKGLDIGSGKITAAEMAGVPHHLLDIASPRRVFSVAQFQKLGQKKLQGILDRGRLPIICGGSGFYIQSLTENLVWPEVKPDLKLRKKLEPLSPAALFKKLEILDPARAKTIDRHNPRRLIRAIEIATALGRVPRLKPSAPNYHFIFLGLNPPPAKLRKLIKTRLIERAQNGLIEEVANLKKGGLSWRRLHDFGLEYRAIGAFVKKNWVNFRVASEPISKWVKREEINPILAELETAIWHYAKRQLTWLKKWGDRIIWLRDYRQATGVIRKSLGEKEPA
jgi:tRNA dimethylallyltransferase